MIFVYKLLKSRLNSVCVVVSNMSKVHLAKGSKQPPKIEGKLRLYSMEYCPYAQRIRLVLSAKNIPHDIVNINLEDKPEWYFKIHPEGKVPAIDTGSEVVVESLDIAEFLEDKYPEHPLHSKDPQVKKRDQELIQQIGSFLTVFHKCLVGKEKKTPEEWKEDLAAHIKEFSSELASRKTKFYGGDKPGMFDYMLWPWIERGGIIKNVLGQRLSFGDEYPGFKEWRKAMLDDPSTKESYHNTDEHWKVAERKIKNLPIDYDSI